MKHLTTAAMVLALAAAGSAEAQTPGPTGQHHTQGSGGSAGGHTGGKGSGQTHGAPTGGGQTVQHFGAGAHGGVHVQTNGGITSQVGQPQGNARNPYANVQQVGRQGAGPRESGFGFQAHAPRDRDQGRSWFNGGAFAHEVQATRHFQIAPYAYPHGWYARTWSYGNYLPLGWYTADYYLDWNDYGLPPPPIGCEWVRVGPDALLVDIWTGEVLSVESGIFD
jgi:Ni/Co efflux regulator RcnB